jgi:DNA-binding MarR family transcriptional regulator
VERASVRAVRRGRLPRSTSGLRIVTHSVYEEDGLRQGELARRAHLSGQTLTTMTRVLERDGLVERRIDESDARATQIFSNRAGA